MGIFGMYINMCEQPEASASLTKSRLVLAVLARRIGDLQVKT
jgi:hypothetical protein